MAALHLTTLDPFVAAMGGKLIETFRTKKAQALLEEMKGWGSDSSP